MSYIRIYADGALKDQRELSAERLTIGRAEDNDIVLKAPGVSKHHAVVERGEHGYTISDNDSTNGVFVNGDRVRRHLLAYWDDIQIYSFRIRYMALARLPGEQDGQLTDLAADQRQADTIEIDVSSVRQLMDLKVEQNTPFVEVGPGAENQRHILDKVNFTIGRARRSDIRLKGWFSPGLVATIQRRNDDFYLVPARRGQVYVNGREVVVTRRLEDNAELRVRGLQLKFYFRPLPVG